MIIEIAGDGYEIGEKIKTLIHKKFQRLKKYTEENTVCKVILRQEKTSYAMAVNVFADTNVRAEVTSQNMYDNIDLIMPKLTGQFRKIQTKSERGKDGAIPKLLFNNDLAGVESEEE